MSKINKYRKFEVLNVTLKGSNLVQASAGTGKTYSITLLVLRLLLEPRPDDPILINQILMVTFTKAAVAELEERVRLFILGANRYLNSNIVDIKEIKVIVDRLTEELGREAVEDKMKEALLLLDDLQIFTIDSFCQLMLNQFALETNHLFSSEMLVDQTPYLIRFANRYWREKVNILPVELLGLIGQKQYDDLIIQEHKYQALDKAVFDTIILKNNIEKFRFRYDEKLDIDVACNLLFTLINNLEGKIAAAISSLDINRNVFIETLNKCALKSMFESPDVDIDTLFTALFNNYFSINRLKALSKISEDVFKEINDVSDHKIKINQCIQKIQNYLIGQGIHFILEQMRQYKDDHNLMTFEDNISTLYRAINDPKTAQKIKHPYRALFVDEFQDTDHKQYTIFSKLFGANTVRFYIGDPKQSIYNFRGADLDTYKDAANQMENRYTMTTNYRSSKTFIDHINLLYKDVENAFDDDEIQYEIIQPGKEDHGNLMKGGKSMDGISVVEYKNKEEIVSTIADQIEALLNSGFTISKEGVERAIQASDIAVLTRGNKEGRSIKNSLSSKNIPSVQIADINIFESDEATWVSHILKSILHPTEAHIHRAIFHPATNISQEQLLNLDSDSCLDTFNQIKIQLNKYGIYPAMMTFLSVFNIRHHIMTGKIPGGDRVIANFIQLVELLHETEKYKSYYGEVLLQWLILQRNTEIKIDDKFDTKAERIESDDDAVQISTIHKSKGLTFNIVFFSDLPASKRPNYDRIVSYKSEEDGNYYIARYPDEGIVEDYIKEQQKENYRLLYVAMTRTVYKLIVCTKKDYVFHEYFKSIPDKEKSQWVQPWIELGTQKTFDSKRSMKLLPARTFKGKVMNEWAVMSYSSISTHGGLFERDEMELPKQAYEQFIFHTFGKGAVHGNFLHDLLEKINFTDAQSWQRHLEPIASQYPTVYKEKDRDFYFDLLNHIVSVDLNGQGLHLQDVPLGKRISEMEFYYDLNEIQIKKWQSLLRDVQLEKNIKNKGVMYGLVDLFFEHEGKYYILDWKSNDLGNHLGAYTSDKLYKAMTENNYHLQYWVYTIAVCRYLKSKISDFDYERDFGGVFYLFIRGIRSGQKTGIFYCKPKLDILRLLDEGF